MFYVFLFLMFFVLFNVVFLLLKHKRTKLCGLLELDVLHFLDRASVL